MVAQGSFIRLPRSDISLAIDFTFQHVTRMIPQPLVAVLEFDTFGDFVSRRIKRRVFITLVRRFSLR